MRTTICASWLLILVITGLQCKKSGSDPGPRPDPPTPANAIAVWETKGDKTSLLSRKDSIPFGVETGSAPRITVNSGISYQTMDGFGAALTGSSSYVINRNLSAAAREELLKQLFTKQGIGIDYLRITIGASDFSTGNYTYHSSPGDTLMKEFSLEKDREDLIPLLKKILEINPQLQIMASPWSAPAWMKTSNSLNGGQLKPEYYPAYARYLVQYIKSMKEEGIVINAITVQNEPLHSTVSYPSMLMYASGQRVFIGDFLGPMLEENNLRTKIIAYDHNWDRPDYGDSVLNYPAAARYIDGTAFHAYAGNVSAMKTLYDQHPEKALYFTEISGGRWAPLFRDNLPWYLKNIIIGTTRNYSKNALFWNLALDENDGPRNNGCSNCRGVVTVTSTGSVIRNEEYYAIGHAGRFIMPGAKRIESNNLAADQIHNVAFLNPDGKKVLIVLNENSGNKAISVMAGSQQFSFTLAGNAVYTFVW